MVLRKLAMGAALLAVLAQVAPAQAADKVSAKPAVKPHAAAPAKAGGKAVAVAAAGGAMSTGGDASWPQIKVGLDGSFPPFSTVDKQGVVKGFDPDMARAICEAMKTRCQFVRIDNMADAIPDLQAGRYDAIVASMSMTDWRRTQIDFTNKYYQPPAKFVGRKGASVSFTEEGLPGERVAVQRNSLHDKYASAVLGSKATILRYQTLGEATDALAAGKADLVLGDSLALQDGFLSTKQGAGFAFMGPDISAQQWFGSGAGIAVRKGNDALRDKINAAIADVRKSGQYQAIANRYFAFNIYGS